MDGFILIDQTNWHSLFNWFGIAQILSILFICLLSPLVCRWLRVNLREHTLLSYPIWFSLVNSCLNSLILATNLIIASLLYSIIIHQLSLLILSSAIFSLGVSLINLISVVLRLAYRENSNFIWLQKTLKLCLWLALILWATNLDAWLAKNLSEVNLVFAKTKVSLWWLIRQVIYLLFGIIVMLWLSGVLDKLISRTNSLDITQRQLLSRCAKVLIILLGIYIILPTLGVDLSTLSLFGGAVGVGIGFGLQKIASNFLSGFIILLDRSIKIGDRIVLNGITGTITQITTRYTVMQAFDGSEVIIPNEQFITNAVVNQTHTHTDISLEISLYISYQANLSLALELIEKIINDLATIRKDKSPTVLLKNMTLDGVEIFIRVWPIDPLNGSSNLRNQLTLLIINQFLSNNIQFAQSKN
jgi:small-conductance mechanosensitive channel